MAVRERSGSHSLPGQIVTVETDVRQLPTHAQLIEPAEPPALVVLPDYALDAIIVPASRPAENLASAIDVAKAIGCQLVVLCSFRTNPAELRKLMDEKSFTMGTVVEVPEAYDHWRFDFETTRWARREEGQRICAIHNRDLSVKRNIGLLLARMLGWNRIFFMDDDIREISAASILGTVSLLGKEAPNGGRYRSAGMTVHEFPDNSVACHARRAIGKYQDVFVSGSVLAVDTSTLFDFFPDIYNEDWLFFHRDAADKLLASSGFHVRQLTYDPFADPERAAGQEFGDVIAEGLYTLLHTRLRSKVPNEDYWRMFLGARKRILNEISERSHLARPEIRQEMVIAVDAAREKLRQITPDVCARYLRAWRTDLEWWALLLETLPSAGAIEKALHELELPVRAQ
jgi:glycosyltransferase involved in cell wall biosynthesis